MRPFRLALCLTETQGSGGKGSKKGIVIHGTVHAR